MAEETEKKPVDYMERTLSQVETVHKAADRLKSSVDKESADQLEIELEKLCFCLIEGEGSHLFHKRSHHIMFIVD